VTPIEKARAFVAMLVRVEELPPPPPLEPRQALGTTRSVLKWLFSVEPLDAVPPDAPVSPRMSVGKMLFSVEDLDAAPVAAKPPRKHYFRWLFSIEKLD
jgi:hypothetical protein